jgi:carboxyl-terminal processing protease
VPHNLLNSIDGFQSANQFEKLSYLMRQAVIHQTSLERKKFLMKHSIKGICCFWLIVLLTTACGPVTAVPTWTLTPEPLPTLVATSTHSLNAQQYLAEALDIIQKNALNSEKVDWVKVRSTAFNLEKEANIPSQTYDTIRYVLEQLNDHHSAFVTPDAAKQMQNSTTEAYPAPKGKILENKIGYIAVFDFGAQAEDEMNKYADEVQTIIMEQNRQSVCGWIVDLSDDLGGNMYPMIAGLGALTGEGDLGSFKDAKGNITNWYYRNGISGEGNDQIAKVSHPEFLLDPEETPVAVLIGPNTASAGEATALSFRGRPNTRFFGKPSYGLTTGNAPFPLSDGALIILTGVVELDRTGKEYGGSITPDVDTSNPEQDATDWLLEQPACKP